MKLPSLQNKNLSANGKSAILAFCHSLDNNNNGSRYLDVSINGL